MDCIPKRINFHAATGLASQEARIGPTRTPKGRSRESGLSGATIGADEGKHRNAHKNQKVQGARCCGKDCVCKFLTQKLLALGWILGQHVIIGQDRNPHWEGGEASSSVAEDKNLTRRQISNQNCCKHHDVHRETMERQSKSTRPRQLQLNPCLILEWPVEVKIWTHKEATKKERKKQREWNK